MAALIHSWRPSFVCARVASALALLALVGPAAAQPSQKTAETRPSAELSFSPTPELDLGALEQLVLSRSARVERATLELEVARAEADQAEILPNPVLDGTWGTIPVGTTNPPNLPDPLGNIPHYDVGLSYTIPVGKRGPLQEKTRALVQAAEADKEALARELALDLAEALGRLATVQLRIEGLQSLSEQGDEAITLAEARVKAQFGIPLEVDRLRIEVDRTRQQTLSAQAELEGALGDCALVLAERCGPFPSSAAAREFLKSWMVRTRNASGRIEDRPDLKALAATQKAAQAELSYAKALVLPDPTVRVGYTHDRFLESGNQMNSFSLSLSFPLPVFDQGQAQKKAAAARVERSGAEATRRKRASLAALDVLRARIDTYLKQQSVLEDDLLPRAHEVLHSLEKAAESGLVPLTDTLQARRTLGELLVEEAENYRAGFEAALDLSVELPTNALSRR